MGACVGVGGGRGGRDRGDVTQGPVATAASFHLSCCLCVSGPLCPPSKMEPRARWGPAGSLTSWTQSEGKKRKPGGPGAQARARAVAPGRLLLTTELSLGPCEVLPAVCPVGGPGTQAVPPGGRVAGAGCCCPGAGRRERLCRRLAGSSSRLSPARPTPGPRCPSAAEFWPWIPRRAGAQPGGAPQFGAGSFSKDKCHLQPARRPCSVVLPRRIPEGPQEGTLQCPT